MKQSSFRAVCLSGLLLAGILPAAAPAGVIPEGLWVMDRAKSRPFMAESHSLWFVKDDGKHLIWVSVETDRNGETHVTSWSGEYGGKPVPVQGNDFVGTLTSPAPGTMRNSGELKGKGTYVETCTLIDDSKRLRCNGSTDDGKTTWLEEFVWVGPSPHPFP